MTSRIPTIAALAACCALAWADSLVADDPPSPRAVDVTSESERTFSFYIGFSRDAEDREDREDRPRQLAEDMEVFGALLQETLEKLYPAATARQAAWLKAEDAWLRAALAIKVSEDAGTRPPTRQVVVRGPKDDVIRLADRGQGQVEAVSDPVAVPLAGYGVVFTVTVPEPRPDEPPATAEGPAEDPKEKCPYLQMDRWGQTRTRLELARNPRAYRCTSCHSDVKRSLGDFGDNGHAGQPAHARFRIIDLNITTLAGFDFHPSAGGPSKSELVDAVTELLADTGRHIRLPVDQRVAVVLRFREAAESAQAARAPVFRPVTRGGRTEYVVDPSARDSRVTLPPPPAGPAPVAPVATPDEAAGDDAMRQRDFKKAAEEYVQAGKKVTERLQELHKDGRKGSDSAVEETQKTLVRLLTKLSLTQGAAGDHAGKDATDNLLKQYPPELRAGSGPSPAGSPPADPYATPADAGKDELAGDLLVKQRNYDEALASYEKALKSLLDGSGAKPRSGEELAVALRTPKVRAEFFRLLRKIAQAAVAGGHLDKAAAPLSLLGFDGAATTHGAHPPTPPAPRLPHTLEISVTKRSLDAVGGGYRPERSPGAPVSIEKLTKEEFREAVTVREFAPQAADGADRAPTPRQPVKVEGVVTEVVELAGRRFVELSAGADDGMPPVEHLALHRVVSVTEVDGQDGQEVLGYTGTAHVVFTAPDRSLAVLVQSLNGDGRSVSRGNRFSTVVNPEIGDEEEIGEEP